ncbi:serine/arginine repetitive matrix protein 1-like isoform X2 [Planococcus citri]|uniref:serine/arginine repetitive matrix protein 1-like isoform X2 n=1 Tax=Planococcus citri TaxID=170843 RepID=UPI0031F76028
MPLNEEEQKALLHFISSSSVMSDKHLSAWTRSVTSGKVVSDLRQTNANSIIMHGKSLIDVITCKKLLYTILIKYLEKMNIPIIKMTREQATHKILYSVWKYPERLQNTSLSHDAQVNTRSDWKFPDLPPIKDDPSNESEQNKSSVDCKDDSSKVTDDNKLSSIVSAVSTWNAFSRPIQDNLLQGYTRTVKDLERDPSESTSLPDIISNAPSQNQYPERKLPQSAPLRDNSTNVPVAREKIESMLANNPEFDEVEMSDTEKITVGIDVFPAIFRMKTKVLGDNNENAEYILNETGAVMTLRGKGSGFIDAHKNESDEPLHVHVRYKNLENKERARELIMNLIDTVQQDFIAGTYGKYYTPPRKPEIIPVPLNRVRRTSSYNSVSNRSPPMRSNDRSDRSIDRNIDRRSIDRSNDRRSVETRGADSRYSPEHRSYDNRSTESRPYEKRSSSERRPFEKHPSLEPRPYEKRPSLEPRPYEKRPSLEPRPYEKRPSLEPRPYESRSSESRPYESRANESRPYDDRRLESRSFDRAPEPRPYESRAPEPRPYESRAPERQPYENRAPEPRPFENRAPEPKPYNDRPSEPRPFDSRPSESSVFDSRPSRPETSVFDGRPLEPRFEKPIRESRFASPPSDPKPFENRPPRESRFESAPADPKTVESRPPRESRFESLPADPKPFENRNSRETKFASLPPDPKPIENRPPEVRPVEKPVPDSTKPGPGETLSSNIEKITIGIESVPAAFNLKSKIYGPNLANVKHIEKVASALLLVEGKGCGVNSSGEESQEPPYILIKYLKPDLKEVARHLILNLIETIQQEYIQLYGRYPGGPQKPQIVPIKKQTHDKSAAEPIQTKKPSPDITPVPPPPPVISKNSSPDRFDNVPPPINFGMVTTKPPTPKLFTNTEPTPVPKPVQPVIPSTNNLYDPSQYSRSPNPEPIPPAPTSFLASQSSILSSVLSPQTRSLQPPLFGTPTFSQPPVQTIQHSEKRPKSPIESVAADAKRFCSTGVGSFNNNSTIASSSSTLQSIPTMPNAVAQQRPAAVVPKGKSQFQRSSNLIPVTCNTAIPPPSIIGNVGKAPSIKPVPTPVPAPTPIQMASSTNTALPKPGILKKVQWSTPPPTNGSSTNNNKHSNNDDEGQGSNPIILSDSEDEGFTSGNSRISSTIKKNSGRDISVQTDDKLYQTQIKNIKCACGRFMHVVTGVRSVETQTIGSDSYRRF